jgi:PAS domain S-box-containing protein
MRDRTDLKRAEEQLRRIESRRSARLAVTQVLADAASLEHAAPLILQAVCHALGWDVGALWTVDRPAGVLRCVDVRPCGEAGTAAFEAATRSAALPPNDSLPGRVWHSDGPLWIADVANDPRFRRAAVAAEVGLHGAFACPIRLGGDFLGVIEFFSRDIREPDPDLLEMMTTLGGQIGQFMERRRTEAALRASEARLQAVLDHTPALVYLVDADGRLVLINRRWREVFGLTTERVAGRPLHDFFPNEVADQFRQNNEQVLLGGVPVEFEEAVPQGGDTRTYISVKVPFGGGAGSAPAVLGISTDITERKRAERAVRESEGRFRGLMEQAPFSVQVFDPDGHTVRVNRAWEELWGVTLDQIAGYNVLQDKQLEAKGILRHIRRAFAGEAVEIPAVEYDPNETIPDRTRHQDPLRWVSAVAYPLKDDGGRVREVVLVHQDITARKRAEEALHEAHWELENRVTQRTAELVRANEFLKALLENVQTGIVACDAAGVLTLFNNVTRALHGVSDEPLTPDRWADQYRLYRPDGETPMAVEDVPLYRALQGERVVNAEMVIRPAGLPPRTVLASGQAFYDHEGEKLGAVVSMHDITQRKRAEEALRKVHEELERRVEERTEQLARANEALRDADRRKDEFLATLAHELRNPLAPISNSLQLMKMPRVDAGLVQKSRDMMERQVHHIVRLVDDLLDVSRVMRGKIELRREPVELATVVARAVETAQPLIEVRGHRLDISLPPESLPLDADPVRLAQVVGNLLTNAAKYTEPNGHIWLSARREAAEAVLRVRDDGIGIAPDVLPHVFELFVQVDHAATRSQGGLGIGLTLVKNLVEMHHGTVEARSGGLGRGCEFVVRLPISDREPPEPAGTAGDGRVQEPRPSGHRLLVVDDNRDAADSLAMLLRLQGHEVRVTHDGPAALGLAPTFRPDVVFLDIGMPGMDGYEVARRLRQQPGLEKVVLAALTGWGQKEDRRRTADAGFDHHLVKPPEPKAVVDILADLKQPRVRRTGGSAVSAG